MISLAMGLGKNQLTEIVCDCRPTLWLVWEQFISY